MNPSFASGLVLLTDGKILVTGYTFSDFVGDFAAIRLNADGSLDTSFGTDGVVIVDNGGSEVSESMVLLEDESFIIVGYHNDTFTVAKFTKEGAIDTSFGNNGWKMVPLGDALSYTKDIALTPEGDIIIAGSILSTNNSWQMAVAKIKANGTPDTDFSSNGTRIYNVGEDNDFIEAVTVQNDRKILLGGQTWMESGPLKYDVAVVRLNADGSFDTSYGDNGVSRVSVVNGENYTNRMILQPRRKAFDNRIFKDREFYRFYFNPSQC